jgi:hypothetical protein
VAGFAGGLGNESGPLSSARADVTSQEMEKTGVNDEAISTIDPVGVGINFLLRYPTPPRKCLQCTRSGLGVSTFVECFNGTTSVCCLMNGETVIMK